MALMRRSSGIGAVICKLRKERDLTQEQLADLLGVTQPNVSYWESQDGQPSLVLLPVIARVLGVTIDDLLAATEPESAAS